MKNLVALLIAVTPALTFAVDNQDLVAHPIPHADPNRGYVCMKFINCMPIVSPGMEMYCSNVDAYIEWAKANCGYEPEVAY